jgi:outer membrane protein assembly factor BamD
MKILVKIAFLMFIVASLLEGCATTKPNGPPDEMFREGERLFQKGDYEDAIAQWKKVKESYQSPELSAKAEINIADAYFLNKDFIEAAAAYEDFRKLHPKHERAEYALYRQAMSHFNQIHSIDTDQTPLKNALITFESYVKLYPAGANRSEVNEKISECRDKQLQYEIYVGRFYLRTDKYAAAIGRFEEALKAFNGLARRDEVLYYLGLAYQEAGQQPKALEAFERIINDFPGSQFMSDASDKKLQNEILVGRAFLETKNYPAAIVHFEKTLIAFSGLSRREEVLYYLGLAYQDAGQKTKAIESFKRLVLEFPFSRFADDASKAIAR